MNPTRAAVLLSVVLAAAAGCNSAPRNAHHASAGGTVVYRPATGKAIDERSQELQRHGYTKENADRKARFESESRARTYEDPNAWARERQRQERSQSREKMEKVLSRLDEN